MGNPVRMYLIIALFLLVDLSMAPPPNRSNAEENSVNSAPENPDVNAESNMIYNLPYLHYLQSIMSLLNEVPKFRKLLESMNQTDNQEGKIADYIDDLGPEVFGNLTKIKKEEKARLEQIKKDMDKEQNALNDGNHLVENDENFTKEDLRILITKAVSDINKMNDLRTMKFKEQQMQMEAEKQHDLAQMTQEEREKKKRELEEEAKKAMANPNAKNLKHPGGTEQIQEVWHESDNMNTEDFNPKTFFSLHDYNGDGFWDPVEVNALFQKELDKKYVRETDSSVRAEEMKRMTYHMIRELDKNNDMRISEDEFLQSIEKQPNNIPDPGWEPTKTEYTEDELKKFREEYAQKMNWGDHAYDQRPLPSSQQQQQQMQYQTQQPVHQQPPEVVYPAGVSNQPPIMSAQIPKETVDPVYGI